ncbi:MAG TPA: translation initiation factor IF-3 [Kofleriaceae bacterium]|nr:translation initiation factor IF-3 [Kofleriaceae bacterium]
MNHRIRVPEIRVVKDTGEQLGIMQTRDALALAEELELDLVEIAPTSRPPVCRIMDYGKFKYEEAKKQRSTKKKQTVVELKEIKFRPKTDLHDLDFKTKHVRRFLEEGNKCRLVVVFRGREMAHPQTGVAMLNKVLDRVKDVATVEIKPSMEGRRMVMILGPLGGVVRRSTQATAPLTLPPDATPDPSGGSRPR